MLLEPVLENNTSYIELVKEIDINLLKSKFNFQNVTVIPANKHSLQEMILLVALMFAII